MLGIATIRAAAAQAARHAAQASQEQQPLQVAEVVPRNTVTLINTTDVAITVRTASGNRVTFLPSYKPIRITNHLCKPVASIHATDLSETSACIADLNESIQLHRGELRVSNLPTSVRGIYYIVDAIVFATYPSRKDFVQAKDMQVDPTNSSQLIADGFWTRADF